MILTFELLVYGLLFLFFRILLSFPFRGSTNTRVSLGVLQHVRPGFGI